jgi:phosphoribosylanthranilate isomerase
VPVADSIDWPRVEALSAVCLPLLDPGAGDGQAFDLALLADRPAGVRFGLAGGLTPETVTKAIHIASPALVDVSSGVESSPGVKDHDAVRAFVAAARAAAGD